jgi:hypothetical protein
MKIKTLTFTLALLGCLALPASAIILIPNGDFSAGSTDWLRVDGAGQGPAVTSPTGGNPGGYGSVTPAGGWGILVSPTVAGAAGGGIPIASLSLTAGSCDLHLRFDQSFRSGSCRRFQMGSLGR